MYVSDFLFFCYVIYLRSDTKFCQMRRADEIKKKKKDE